MLSVVNVSSADDFAQRSKKVRPEPSVQGPHDADSRRAVIVAPCLVEPVYAARVGGYREDAGGIIERIEEFRGVYGNAGNGL